MKPDWICWKVWPCEYGRAGGVSVFTILYGFVHVLRVGKVSALIVLGRLIFKIEPFPRYDYYPIYHSQTVGLL